MKGKLKPYPKYKESGMVWLGKIPTHWDLRRMKLLLREIDSRSSRGKEQLLRVSQYTGVTQRKASDGSGEPDTRASSLVGYKQVAVDDLVINIMLAWNGSMGVSRYDGITSPAYCVYRFQSSARPWYYHELLRTPVYKGRIKTASRGVVESRLRLYSDDLGRIEAIQPPHREQDAIVRFLDHANRRIERTIRAKKKLIELLNEQKQAIIHRAVTRGLDPNVRLKPSGVHWLGNIPEHWEVLPVKRCSKVISKGTTPSTEGRDILETGQIRFFKAENISGGEIVSNQERSSTNKLTTSCDALSCVKMTSSLLSQVQRWERWRSSAQSIFPRTLIKRLHSFGRTEESCPIFWRFGCSQVASKSRSG